MSSNVSNFSKHINIKTKNHLFVREGILIDKETEEEVARVVNNVPRFIAAYQDYASNFGYQWNKWNSILSDSRNSNLEDAKYKLLLKRTQFDKFETSGKTILECGCGGGDDTEILLRFPFSEVHAFDLSTAVDRARKFLSDERLVLSQASIFEIPYADKSFDFVFCHRVLQHTPDPVLALKSICQKVKVGGVLFVHSYHRSKKYMQHFKYKYRFITKRIPHFFIEQFLNVFATPMHALNSRLYKSRWGKKFAFGFIPLEYSPKYSNFSKRELIQLEKLVTFDALTPMYDTPMRWSEMKSIVEAEGFEIKYFNDNPSGSPIYLTAVRKS